MYDPKKYQPLDFDNPVGYDVIIGSYDDVVHLARFEDKADAEHFQERYNLDLLDGCTDAMNAGEYDRQRRKEIMDLHSARIDRAYGIAVVPKGETFPIIFNLDYGKRARKKHA